MKSLAKDRQRNRLSLSLAKQQIQIAFEPLNKPRTFKLNVNWLIGVNIASVLL